MNVNQYLKLLIPKFILESRNGAAGSIKEFKFGGELDVKKDIQDKYGYDGSLLSLFADNKEYLVHKWHHYIPIYDRYFSPYRGRKIRFLEIGVSKGGSLQMWRKYFGEEAIIFGIDIDPSCKQYNGLAGQVRIGSQIDKDFLESVIREMGGLDVVLDDGSHHMDHIPNSLKYIFPHLSDGGIYMIEDLHCAYWKDWGGGYRSRKNFFGYVMDLVDDIHHWYHKELIKQPEVSKSCFGIHVHDSIVVLEKSKVHKPVHSTNA